MKTIICVLLTMLMLMAFTCSKEEGENCHHNIIYKNVSADTIIFAEKWRQGTHDLWFLSGVKVAPDQLYVNRIIRDCFESAIPDYYEGGKFELYIVDPILYNAPGDYYSFDSIEIKNRVLKHYSLTVDDLRVLNFTVTYPDDQ